MFAHQPARFGSIAVNPIAQKKARQTQTGYSMAYVPLNKSENQVRLLHLWPALRHRDKIKCTFSIVTLNDTNQFEALSYAWGDVELSHSANVDGEAVMITKNLFTALKYLRFKLRKRTLWIDALCINQSDLGERSHQVALMGLVYRQASLVVIWLGEAWDGSEMAIEFLQRMGKNEHLHLV